MRVGIFAKTFVRATVEETLEAVKAHDILSVQFNMVCAGLGALPDEIPAEVVARIRAAHGARGLSLDAISGTFNMIHPDRTVRREGLRRLGVLAAACRGLGTSLISLCTGTRDPHDMWRRHAANDTTEAWRDLGASMAAALDIAESRQVTLAFEPEIANVVDSARQARRLLDEMRSPRLKVLLDAANLTEVAAGPQPRAVLDEALDLLADDIALVHAKDLQRIDCDAYVAHLRRAGYSGPLVLHGLSETQVPMAAARLRGALAATERSSEV